jgi:fucose 4-O-acetylase-like acetyltransferase
MLKKQIGYSKLEFLNLLNVFAILLVVLGHVTHPYSGSWAFNSSRGSTMFKLICGYIYTFHMPLFVAISGYLFYISNEVKNKYTNIKILIIEKYKRLILPMLSVGLLYMIPIKILVGYYDCEFTLKNILVTFKGDYGHLWFLLMLFNTMIIFYIAKFIHINELINKYIIILFLVVANLFGYCYRFNFVELTEVAMYLIYFCMGYELCKHQILHKIKIEKLIMLLFINIFFIGLEYLIREIKIENINEIIKAFCKLVNGSLGVLIYFKVATIIQNKIENLCNNKIIQFLRKDSMGIYLFHEPIIFAIYSINGVLEVNPLILVVVTYIITMALSISITAIVRNILRVKF